jgi:bis(5'-nucleosyl)-tetraphosphatase (symmetrical)
VSRMSRVDSKESALQHVFIGDVQGCGDELDELLDRVHQSFGRDYHLHVVGDLINRGPRNLHVLNRVRELVEAGMAEYILGNHELSLLKVAFGLRKLDALDTFAEVLESADASDWIEWLRGRPLLECGELMGGERYVMVHAAVHPEWGYEELTRRVKRLEARLGGSAVDDAVELLGEEPESCARDRRGDLLARITSCRSVSGKKWFSDVPMKGTRPWHEAWAEQRHDYGVVYGHWALQGLHLAPGLRGLDTGCVHHDRGRVGLLTAWLPGLQQAPRGDVFSLPEKSLWQVQAKRRYYDC